MTYLDVPPSIEGAREGDDHKLRIESALAHTHREDDAEETSDTSVQPETSHMWRLLPNGAMLATLGVFSSWGWQYYHSQNAPLVQPSLSLQACESLGANEFHCILAPELDLRMPTDVAQTMACTLDASDLKQATFIREEDGSLRIQAEEPLLSRLAQCVSDTTHGHGHGSPQWAMHDPSAHLVNENTDEAEFGKDL